MTSWIFTCKAVCVLLIHRHYVSSALRSVDRHQELHSKPSARVSCTTTKGDLVIDVHRDWAPIGADHFIELVKDRFYTNIAFFRCVKGFITQFGISDIPSKKHWHHEEIPDDPNRNLGIQKNYISYAGGGPNTRSTQLFIAFEYQDFLGKEPWETPFGVVSEGQATLDALYKGYGEMQPFNKKGIDQQIIFQKGNRYVYENFPKTDFIKECWVVEEGGVPVKKAARGVENVHIISDAELEKEMLRTDANEGANGEQADDVSQEEQPLDENGESREEEQGRDAREGSEDREREGEGRNDAPDAAASDRNRKYREKSAEPPLGPDELDKLTAFEKKTQVQKKQYETGDASRHRPVEGEGFFAKWRSTILLVVGLVLFVALIIYALHRRSIKDSARAKRS